MFWLLDQNPVQVNCRKKYYRLARPKVISYNSLSVYDLLSDGIHLYMICSLIYLIYLMNWINQLLIHRILLELFVFVSDNNKLSIFYLWSLFTFINSSFNSCDCSYSNKTRKFLYASNHNCNIQNIFLPYLSITKILLDILQKDLKLNLLIFSLWHRQV